MIKKIVTTAVISTALLIGANNMAQAKELAMKPQYICYATFDLFYNIGVDQNSKGMADDAAYGKKWIKKKFDFDIGNQVDYIIKVESFFDEKGRDSIKPLTDIYAKCGNEQWDQVQL